MDDILHPIQWTPERIERLWNYYGSNPAYRDAYFAKHSGHRILREIEAIAGIGGDLVDIGCGPGYMLEHLVDRPGWATYTGVDTSEDSLQEVRAKANRTDRSIEAVAVPDAAAIPDNSKDLGFLIEVAEHCDDDVLRSIFQLARRVLRASGRMVVTTPSDEQLDRSMQACPECGCVYHRWQHIRTWSCEALAAFMETCGFETQFAYTCNFGRDDLGRSGLRRVAARLRRGDRWRDSFAGLPHAVVIAAPAKTETGA